MKKIMKFLQPKFRNPNNGRMWDVSKLKLGRVNFCDGAGWAINLNWTWDDRFRDAVKKYNVTSSYYFKSSIGRTNQTFDGYNIHSAPIADEEIDYLILPDFEKFMNNFRQEYWNFAANTGLTKEEFETKSKKEWIQIVIPDFQNATGNHFVTVKTPIWETPIWDGHFDEDLGVIDIALLTNIDNPGCFYFPVCRNGSPEYYKFFDLKIDTFALFNYEHFQVCSDNSDVWTRVRFKIKFSRADFKVYSIEFYFPLDTLTIEWHLYKLGLKLKRHGVPQISF